MMNELKFCVNKDLVGYIRNWQLIADDIYFIAGEHNEGYVVPSDYTGGILSPKALTLGERRGDLLYYLDGERLPIAKHDLLVWQLTCCAESERNSLQSKLDDCCMYGMIEFPDFFGTYPAPTETPTGTPDALRKVRDGIYWAHCCSGWFLGICEPIWFPSLSIIASDYGTRLKDYLFFAVDTFASAIPLFELRHEYPEIEKQIASEAALYHALHSHFGDYVQKYNTFSRNMLDQIPSDTMTSASVETALFK